MSSADLWMEDEEGPETPDLRTTPASAREVVRGVELISPGMSVVQDLTGIPKPSESLFGADRDTYVTKFSGPLEEIGQISIDKDNMKKAYAAFGDATENQLARYLIETYRDKGLDTSYEKVRAGTDPLLQMSGLPESMKGKGLTDAQIIDIYSTLGGPYREEDGASYNTLAYLRGLGRSTGGMLGMAKGAQYGFRVPAPLPVKLGAAALGGLGGALGLTIGSDEVIQSLLGRVSPEDMYSLTPETRQRYEAMLAAGDTTPFVFMGALSPTSRFAYASLVSPVREARNLTRYLELQKGPYPLTAEQAANPYMRRYIENLQKEFAKFEGGPKLPNLLEATQAEKAAYKASIPLSARAAASIEEGLIRGGQELRKRPGATLALESTAVPATAFTVEMAARKNPESSGWRLAAEGGGAVTPAAIALLPMRHLAGLVTSPDFYKIKGILTSRAQNQAQQEFLYNMELLKENPLAAADAMERHFFDGPIAQGGKLKPEFESLFYGTDRKGRKKLIDRGDRPFVVSMALDSLPDSKALLNLEALAMSSIPPQRASKLQEDALARTMQVQRLVIENIRRDAVRLAGDDTVEGASELSRKMLEAADKMEVDYLSLLMDARAEGAQAKLIDALSRVGGEDLRPDKVAAMIGTTVDTQNKLFRNIEQKAWQEVDPTVVVTGTFKNEKGEAIAVPNFITDIEDEIASKGVSQLAKLWSDPDFKALYKTVRYVNNRLGRPTLDLDALVNSAGAKEFESLWISTGDTPARRTFDEAVDQLGLNRLDDNSVAVVTELDRALKIADPTDRASAIDSILANGRNKRKSRAMANRYRRLDPGADIPAFRNLVAAKKQELIEANEIAKPRIAPSLEGDTDIALKELTGARSTALAMARRTATVEDDLARIASNVADGLLLDIMNVPGAGPAYNSARQVSRAYNEHLKRRFGGDVLRTNNRGREVIDEALLVQKLKSGGADAMAVRMNDLNSLDTMMMEEARRLYSPDDPIFDAIREAGNDSNQALKNALNLAAREVMLGPEARLGLTPQEIAQKQADNLSQFRARYRNVFEHFGSLGKELDDAISGAVTAERFLEKVSEANVRLSKRIDEDTSLKAALGLEENILNKVERAYTGQTPLNDFAKMADRIKIPARRAEARLMFEGEGLGKTRLRSVEALRAKQKAMLGFDPEMASEALGRSILDYALRASDFDRPDKFSPEKLYTILFDKMPNAAKESDTLASVLVEQGFMPKKELVALQSSVESMVRHKAVIAAAAKGDRIADDVPPIIDLYVRILGSRIGTHGMNVLPGGSAGAGESLIASAAGVRFLNKFTKDLPAVARSDALLDIMTDPEQFIRAARAPKTAAEKGNVIGLILRKVRALGQNLFVERPTSAAGRAGGIGTRQIIEEMQAPEEEAPPPPPNRGVGPQSSVRPTAAPARQVAMPQPPQIPPRPAPTMVPPSVASAPTQAPTDPATRQRYAALFPSDLASGMIRQQGIGSLMG